MVMSKVILDYGFLNSPYNSFAVVSILLTPPTSHTTPVDQVTNVAVPPYEQ